MDAESTSHRDGPCAGGVAEPTFLTGVAVMTLSSEMTLSSAWKAAGACAKPYVYRFDKRMVNFQQGVKINKKLFDAPRCHEAPIRI